MILFGVNYYVDVYLDGMCEFICDYEWDGSIEFMGYLGVFIEYYLMGYENFDGFGVLF